jgi:hypothetical protein
MSKMRNVSLMFKFSFLYAPQRCCISFVALVKQ